MRRDETFIVLLLIGLLFNIRSSVALVGGQVTQNSKVVRLSECKKIVSYTQGTFHGCDDISLATGSFISQNEILTAGHFAAHFIFKNKAHSLKIGIDNNEVLLSYKVDFFIRMPSSYYKYRKSVFNKHSSPKKAAKTCSTDIAVLVLTKKGLRKIKSSDYYRVSLKNQQQCDESIQMYGYGNNKFRVYNEKTATFKSTLSWILSLGDSSRKTWVEEKSIDKKLRVGSNTIRPYCDSLIGLGANCDSEGQLDSIKSKMDNSNYYSSFMASGDSGGPALVDNKIVGVFCAIKSLHNRDGIHFVNLITPTYSKVLKGFWSNSPKDVKVFK